MALAQKRSRKNCEERKLAAFLLVPAVLIMAVVTIYPLLRSLWISMLEWDLTKPFSGHPFIGFQNYISILKDPVFWQCAKTTGIFVVGAVSLEITLGLLIAMLLNKNFVGKNIVRMLSLLPWAIPSVVNGIMWKWILNPSYGALNGLLYSLGLIDEYIVWLGSPGLALFMVILADVWKETPFIMLLFLAALQTIPRELYEAAEIDGANGIKKFWNITLPLIKPTMFVALSLRTIWALKSFDLIYTLTAGGPSNGTNVIGFYTYLKTFVSLDLGKGAASAYLMTFVVMIVVLLYQKTLNQKGTSA